MNTFKQFLEEGRDAPLYHSTTLFAFGSIMAENELRAKTDHSQDKLLIKKDSDDPVYGISLSRSLAFAKSWSDGGVIFKLNQRKLAQNYRIIPLQFWRSLLDSARFAENNGRNPAYKGQVSNEYEEFVVTKTGIKPLLKYLDEVMISKQYTTRDGGWGNNPAFLSAIETLRKAGIRVTFY